MTTEAVERALAELATRADLHPVPDRVRAVHRRARRNAAVRVAASTLAVAAVAVGALAGTGGLPFARDQVPDRRPAPSGPHLEVSLHPAVEVAADLPPRQPGIPVVIDVTLRGRVPVATAWSADQSILRQTMDWGDDSYTGWPFGESYPQPTPTAPCPPAGRLGELIAAEPMTHHYEKPGTYTLTYTATACGVAGTVTRRLTITVRAP